MAEDKILFQVNKEENELKFIINKTTELERRALSNILNSVVKALDKENEIEFETIK